MLRKMSAELLALKTFLLSRVRSVPLLISLHARATLDAQIVLVLLLTTM